MLSLKNICKTYNDKWNSYKVLENLNVDIYEGEFVYIIGKSGCGKTTFLNIVGLLDDFDSGEYLIEGKNVKTLKSKDKLKLRRETFGFIFQSYHLINELNVLENICMPPAYSGKSMTQAKKIAEELLSDFDLEHLGKKFPFQLSGGEKQRVGIARAISNSPKIIIADEPTGNLDIKNSQIVNEKLQLLNSKGVTVIMVTHDIEHIKQKSGILKKTNNLETGKQRYLEIKNSAIFDAVYLNDI